MMDAAETNSRYNSFRGYMCGVFRVIFAKYFVCPPRSSAIHIEFKFQIVGQFRRGFVRLDVRRTEYGILKVFLMSPV